MLKKISENIAAFYDGFCAEEYYQKRKKELDDEQALLMAKNRKIKCLINDEIDRVEKRVFLQIASRKAATK